MQASDAILSATAPSDFEFISYDDEDKRSIWQWFSRNVHGLFIAYKLSDFWRFIIHKF